MLDIERAVNENKWLGQVTGVEHIGEYDIVAFHPCKRKGARLTSEIDRDRIEYTIYISGKRIGMGAESLDMALLSAIAHRHDGPNSRAAFYMARMLGLKEES